jgi:ABC-type dipeptide/oligopeptide/nickel transport system ATPase component
MPSTAFNPRGTSGSGKTTIVRAIMAEAKAEPYRFSEKKPLIYRGELLWTPLYVLGSYASTCGGCDTIDSVHKVAAMLQELMGDPEPKIVVYEGLMISHMIGTVGLVAKLYGDRHVMGFLDTPLSVCLERVQQRRDARGTTKPFNPTNTIKDHASVQRCRNNAVRDKFRVVDIKHTDSVTQSFGVLYDLSKIANASTLDQGAGQHSQEEGAGPPQAVDGRPHTP